MACGLVSQSLLSGSEGDLKVGRLQPVGIAVAFELAEGGGLVLGHLLVNLQKHTAMRRGGEEESSQKRRRQVQLCAWRQQQQQVWHWTEPSETEQRAP